MSNAEQRLAKRIEIPPRWLNDAISIIRRLKEDRLDSLGPKRRPRGRMSRSGRVPTLFGALTQDMPVTQIFTVLVALKKNPSVPKFDAPIGPLHDCRRIREMLFFVVWKRDYDPIWDFVCIFRGRHKQPHIPIKIRLWPRAGVLFLLDIQTAHSLICFRKQCDQGLRRHKTKFQTSPMERES